MKTILVLISIMILGLYSCEKASTSAIQEEKKYTLEEILADTNWIEITDTLHYNDIPQLTFRTLNWDHNSIKIISNTESYEKLKIISDTTYPGYSPIILKDINFNSYDLIGLLYNDRGNVIKKMYFKNINTKQVFYFVELTRYTKDGIVDEIYRESQNWLIIPKIPNDYKIFTDINVKYEEK